MRYTLDANFALRSDMELDNYGWQAMVWEWQDDIVPLEGFEDPVGDFPGAVSGFLEVGVVYGLSSGLSFLTTLDASLPMTASLIDGAGIVELQLTAVPLPAAAWFFGSALLGLGAIKRKKAV